MFPQNASDDASDDVIAEERRQPEVESGRAEKQQRMEQVEDRKQIPDARLVLHQSGVATVTYISRVPETLSGWTIVVSLSRSSSHDIVEAGHSIFSQLQAAIDQLTLEPKPRPPTIEISKVQVRSLPSAEKK